MKFELKLVNALYLVIVICVAQIFSQTYFLLNYYREVTSLIQLAEILDAWFMGLYFDYAQISSPNWAPLIILLLATIALKKQKIGLSDLHL